MDEKDKKKEEEQERIKPERMDHLEKGAKIGKSKEGKKTGDKKEDN
ncbi:MAG: hypothetical protein WBC20_05690 [Candidatus Aminicenantaceae bacterium]